MKNRRTMLIVGGVALILVVFVGYTVGGFGSSDPPSTPKPIAGNDFNSDDDLSGSGTVVERDAQSGDAVGQSAGRLVGSGLNEEDLSLADGEPQAEKKKKRRKKRSRKGDDSADNEEEATGTNTTTGPKFTLQRKLP